MFIILLLINIGLTLVNGYQIGDLYVFKYETSVQISTPKRLDSVSTFQSDVLVEPLRKENVTLIIKLSIKNELFEDNTVQLPFLIELNVETQQVLRLFFMNQDSSGSILIKKGLADLFNLNHLSDKESSFIGDCQTSNERLNVDLNYSTIKKFKFNCTRVNLASDEFKRNEKILNSLIDRKVESLYKVSNNFVIQNLTVSDVSKVYSEFNSKSFHLIESKQTLINTEAIKQTDLDLDSIDEFKNKQTLAVEFELNEFKSRLNDLRIKSNVLSNDKTIQQILKPLNKKFKSGSSKACRAYLALFRHIRSVSPSSQTLHNHLKDYVNKDKIFKILIEAFVASQSESALNAVLKGLDIENLNTDNVVLNEKKSKLVQAFLVSSSLLSTFSTSKLFEVVESIAKNPNKMSKSLAKSIQTQAYLTLGSLVNLATTNNVYNKKMEATLDVLLKQNKLNIKDFNTKLVYLESLKNTKHFKCSNYVAKIDNFKNSAKLSLSILKYLDSLNGNIFENELFKDLLIILNDKTMREELRIEALNIILDKYTDLLSADDSPILENILRKIFKSNDKTSKEFLFFCQQLIWNKIKINPRFKLKSFDLFRNSFLKLSLMDFISYNGSSLVVSGLTNESSGSGIGFKLKQLMTDDGFMRSVDFSVNYIDKEKNFIDFLKFELYANNLNALSSGGLSGTGGDPSISFHLSLMGQKLNIAQLFKGLTEMLAIVWKLPTKMTSLFDINFLLSDQNEYLILQNGLIIKLETLGAISFDMSGLTDISIWGQTAKLNFKKNVAVRIEQKLTLFNNLNIFAESEFDFDTQIIVDLGTDVDFSSSPSKVCIKMSNRKFYLKESSKLTIFKQNKLDLVKKVQKQTPIQPFTFMLSRQAVSYC